MNSGENRPADFFFIWRAVRYTPRGTFSAVLFWPTEKDACSGIEKEQHWSFLGCARKRTSLVGQDQRELAGVAKRL